jgi:hypothetical protein
MEDPWANAWGDSSKSVLPVPSPLWAAPSVSVLHGDHEDDLSTPSWPKDSASAYDTTDLAPEHIWSTTDLPSSTWNPPPSTFDEISLAGECEPQQDPLAETQEAQSYPHEEEGAWAIPGPQLQKVLPTFSPSFSETVSILPEATNVPNNAPGTEGKGQESWSSSQSPTSPTPPLPKSTSAPLSEDVDGFGSFETGQDNQEKESWTPTNSVFPPISSANSKWDSAWKVEPEEGKSEQEDAWEAARRLKEIQDRHVASHP